MHLITIPKIKWTKCKIVEKRYIYYTLCINLFLYLFHFSLKYRIIVCNKISELYDSFEMTRKNTLEVFLSAGFSIVSYQKWLKSTAMVDGVVVKITL